MAPVRVLEPVVLVVAVNVGLLAANVVAFVEISKLA